MVIIKVALFHAKAFGKWLHCNIHACKTFEYSILSTPGEVSDRKGKQHWLRGDKLPQHTYAAFIWCVPASETERKRVTEPYVQAFITFIRLQPLPTCTNPSAEEEGWTDDSGDKGVIKTMKGKNGWVIIRHQSETIPSRSFHALLVSRRAASQTNGGSTL